MTLEGNGRALPASEVSERLLPRLLYFGEVPVEHSYHGSALLYRLLRNYPKSKILVLEREGRRSEPSRRLPRVTYRSIACSWAVGAGFVRRRLPVFYLSIWRWLARHWASRAITQLGGFNPEAILTVHEGGAWLGAYELAKRLRVPCHLIAHDDWLRGIPPTTYLHRALAKGFQNIYRSMKTRFVVSPFMEEEFRKSYGAGGEVLYPSRSPERQTFRSPPGSKERQGRRFTLAYGGTAFDGGYLAALKDVAVALGRMGGDLLLFGPVPEKIEQTLSKLPGVTCCGLVAPEELIVRFRAEADVLFVPMSFAEEDKVNMSVSFPSKLADYTMAGLPLLIYGPSYSSAVRWAKDNRACCEVVDSNTTNELMRALERLRESPEHRQRLGTNALFVGDKYFSSEQAETVFYSKLTAGSN